jgi:hypothetical protein
VFLLAIAYGGAAILYEKIVETDNGRCRWQTRIDEILPTDSH